MSNEFKSWDELTPLEQAQGIYWDMYKEAHNFRPRGIDTSSWTLEDFEVEFANLNQVIEREAIQRQESEAQAVVDFEARVSNLMHTGTNRDQVITWLMDAECANGDFEYFCYTQGLPYNYFRKTA